MIGETVIKRYDELDLQILKTGLDKDIKTGNQFKKDMGQVFGENLSTISKTSKTRVKQWNSADTRCPVSYKDAFDDGDYLSLMKMAYFTHLDESVSKEARIEDHTRTLNSFTQRVGEGIEAFADRFERQVQTMELL